VRPRRRAVELHEALEDALSGALGHAHPRVDDLEVDLVARWRSAHRDGPVVGELVRVRQQAPEDPTQPRAVRSHGESCGHLEPHGVAPLAGGLERCRGQGVQLHDPDPGARPPGLDARELEHLLDHLEQVTARADEAGQIGGGGVVAGKVEVLPDQLRVAEDRVEGGAELVAHGGEELRLGPAGRRGLALGGLLLGDLGAQGGGAPLHLPLQIVPRGGELGRQGSSRQRGRSDRQDEDAVEEHRDAEGEPGLDERPDGQRAPHHQHRVGDEQPPARDEQGGADGDGEQPEHVVGGQLVAVRDVEEPPGADEADAEGE